MPGSAGRENGGKHHEEENSTGRKNEAGDDGYTIQTATSFDSTNKSGVIRKSVAGL